MSIILKSFTFNIRIKITIKLTKFISNDTFDNGRKMYPNKGMVKLNFKIHAIKLHFTKPSFFFKVNTIIIKTLMHKLDTN